MRGEIQNWEPRREMRTVHSRTAAQRLRIRVARLGAWSPKCLPRRRHESKRIAAIQDQIGRVAKTGQSKAPKAPHREPGRKGVKGSSNSPSSIPAATKNA